MPSGCPEIPDNHCIIQFTFIKDVANVLRYGLFALAEQLSNMRLRQPNRFLFEPYIYFYSTIRGLVDE
jgi:hypothetical protein